MIKKLLIPAVAALAFFASCGSNNNNNAAAETKAVADTVAVEADSVGYIVKLGDVAPDFTCTLTDGKEVKLSDLRGKVVMLQFTASWCGVCRKEMPFIESDIWQKHKENPNFVLVGIDRDEPLDTVVEFGKSVNITYPLACGIHDIGHQRQVL
mgnify:CR=1 FL=1